MNIVVVGTGYVGLAQAACLASLGHRVAGVDINEAKIADLRLGKVSFFEPGLPDLVKAGLENGRLTFHLSQAEAHAAIGEPDLVFCCVQTPRLDDGGCDLTAVFAVAKESGKTFKSTVFVLKSTVPPGTRSLIRRELQNDAIEIGSNPEFLREGKSVYDFLHPERILIGAETDRVAQKIKEAHQGIEAPIFVLSVESAQLAKYAANTMLAMRLALMNEIAIIADCVQADIKDVEAVVGSDARIGSKFLRAGAGFGGSCFPKDVLALADVAKECGCESLLIAPIIESNDRQPSKFVQKMTARLGTLAGKRIAVWGLAFNKDTDDVRESPALKIVELLLMGGATVRVFDPKAMEKARIALGDRVEYATSSIDALKDTDALATLTEWPMFESESFEEVKKRLRAPLIFDGKNFLPRERLEDLGFEIHGMGLCAKHLRRPRSI